MVKCSTVILPAHFSFQEIDVKPIDVCPLCPLLTARRDAKSLTVVDLMQLMKADTSNLSDHASQSLLCAVTSCARFVENRYCNWLVSREGLILWDYPTANTWPYRSFFGSFRFCRRGLTAFWAKSRSRQVNSCPGNQTPLLTSCPIQWKPRLWHCVVKTSKSWVQKTPFTTFSSSSLRARLCRQLSSSHRRACNYCGDFWFSNPFSLFLTMVSSLCVSFPPPYTINDGGIVYRQLLSELVVVFKFSLH